MVTCATSNKHAGLWLLASVLVFTLVGLWAYQVLLSDREQQNAIAQHATAWGLNACLVLGIAGAIGVIRPTLSIIGRKRAATALVVALVAWVLAGIAPRTNRIFFDEQIYMQIGQTYAHTGTLTLATYARAEHGIFNLFRGDINKQPQGWPYVYGQCARVFGVSARLGQEINRVSVGITAGVLCLALFLVPWRLPPGAPVAAGFAWALTPFVPWWGRTAAVEPSSATTAAIAFCAAILYVRMRGRDPVRGYPAAGALLAASTAFAAYFRPESLFVFGLVTLILWIDEDDFIKDYVAWGSLLFALALITPHLLQLWSMRAEDWGATDGRRFDLAFVGANLRSNLGYFINGKEFPIAGTALTLLGMAWLVARARMAAIVWAAWFIPTWGIFILFYAGGLHYGASNRYSLISAAPIAVLIGVGGAALFEWTKRHKFWFGLACGLITLSWLRALSFVPELGREAVEVQEEVKFVARTSQSLTSGSLVISQVPSMWLIEGQNASTWGEEVEYLARNQLRELLNQYPGGIYYHYGYWENVEKDRAEISAKILIEYNAVEVARLKSHAMVFALFRLDTPDALGKFGGEHPRFPVRREGELDLTLQRLSSMDSPQ